tara:strand:+ start:477 stop:1490 length:1014 start_codon:yes stop_codon:yes gene_type:complete
MIPKEKLPQVTPQKLAELLENNYFNLMASFYDSQSTYLTGIYKKYGNLETGNIMACFTRNMHLSIIRERENDLNFNVSIYNYWNNIQNVNKPVEKITNIAKTTNIPKETIRRKIILLQSKGYLVNKKNSKGYSINNTLKNKEEYISNNLDEIKILTKFTNQFSKSLKINLDTNLIEEEIKKQFSFYMYHFLNYELQWLKMWRKSLKDIDLLLIVLQAVIPNLACAAKNKAENVKVENIFKIIGQLDENCISESSVSTASISDITGIPRATCIRKLEKLVKLGFLNREHSSKRYYINQNTPDRTKNIITKDNVNHSIKNFSNLLSIIINSLVATSKAS